MTIYELVIIYPLITEEKICSECDSTNRQRHSFLADDDQAAIAMAKSKIGEIEYKYKSACCEWWVFRCEITNDPDKNSEELIYEEEGSWVI